MARDEANKEEKEKFMTVNKILLDTDIGDDIDDAYALEVLLAEKANLVGVTTVYRNCNQRAKIAAKILELHDKADDISVYEGEDIPEKEPIKKFEKADKDGKAMIPHYIDEEMRDGKTKKGAVNFILETLKNYPHEITILAIGPFTNLARAIEKDRETFGLVKEVVIMGGNYSERDVEWNVLCDSEAAKTLFESGVSIRAVGVDITRNCKFDDKMLKFLRGLKAEKYRLLVRMTEIWIEQNIEKQQPPTMHDPLTTATLFYNDLVVFKKGKFRVGTLREERGMTLPDQNGVEIEYAVSADVNAFMKLLQELFSSNN